MKALDFNKKIEALLNCGYNLGVAKEPEDSPQDGGVPLEMFEGEVDEEGWVKWKTTLSKLTENDIKDLFLKYGINPPQTLIEYFKADCHLIDQVNSGERMIMFPTIPSDNPLGPMKDQLESWGPLIKVGYLPIAEMEDGWGPICYSLSNGKIVWFDHEELINAGEENIVDHIQDLKKELFESIDDFYESALSAPTST